MAKTPLEPRDLSETRPVNPTTTAHHVADGPRRPASVATGGAPHRKRGLGWLWWALGALAVLAVVGLLAGVFGGGDDDAPVQQPAQTEQQGQAGGAAADDAAGGAAAGATEDGAAATGTGTGTLTAGGTDLLGATDGTFADQVGQDAEGSDLVVQSVVRAEDDPEALEGFFVGREGEQERVYVEWGGDVGADEADFRPEEGQRVDLSGPVRPAPEDPAQTLKLDAEDAQTVTEQGAYVNADQVRAAQG